MKQLREKLTYANVVATLALFLVLAGGGAFAASHLLPKNSVGTKQIKNGAVTGAKIKRGTITGSNIDLGSLGTVPNAANASTAAIASSAATAANAANASHAGIADLATRAAAAGRADVAGDAETLAGRGPEAFASATDIIKGVASYEGPAEVVLTIPGKVTVETIPGERKMLNIGAESEVRWTVASRLKGASFKSGSGIFQIEKELEDFVIRSDAGAIWQLTCGPDPFRSEMVCIAVGF